MIEASDDACGDPDASGGCGAASRISRVLALAPLPLYFDPSYFGLFAPAADKTGFVRQVAMIWLALGIGGVLFRTVQLFLVKDVQTGLVWATKILTDPFHDIKLYHKAPLHLLARKRAAAAETSESGV